MIAAAIVTIGFSACTAKESKDVEVLNTYVDSVENLTPVYTTENWTVIDNGYQERLALAEKDYAAMDADAKAKADASKARYDALRARYEQNIREAEAKVTANAKTNYRQVLRDNLFGQGKIGDDMQFGYVTGENLLSVFQNFVDVVSDNRDKYSREDWDEIKVLYEALNTRKNAVEKDLATNDNLKIAGLKIKFAAIKATNRGGTKVTENAEAKQ